MNKGSLCEGAETTRIAMEMLKVICWSKGGGGSQVKSGCAEVLLWFWGGAAWVGDGLTADMPLP